MLKVSKRVFVLLLLIPFTASIFSYSYKIDNVIFSITGLTKESAMRKDTHVDTETVFADEESFLVYLNELKQKILNTRNFEDVDITYTATEPENDICSVTLDIQTTDSFHFLLLPYIKFSTSDGLSVKVKMKDTNFLGSLRTLDASIDFQFEPDEDENLFRVFEPEINFSYDMPFKFGGQDFVWLNDYSISYTWGENTPEWSLETGLTWIYSLKKTTLELSFTQGFYRDLYYRDFGDDTYLSENLKLSAPMTLVEIPHFESINFTPYINFNINLDPFVNNGYLGFTHPDLIGPEIKVGATFDYREVNWDGNFRNGFSLSIGPSVSYNFASIPYDEITRLNIGISATSTAYKSFEHIGFNSRLWAFTHIINYDNRIYGSAKVDSYLRGIVDGRKSAYNPDNCQASTPVALVFNFDVPIHICTTDWENFILTKKLGFMRYFNFELQISPFFDIALIKTTEETHGYERLFNLKDGFYTSGLEILVFPEKWKGIEVRLSAGFDIGTLFYSPFLETSWRNKHDEGEMWLKTAEISIGLGLHY